MCFNFFVINSRETLNLEFYMNVYRLVADSSLPFVDETWLYDVDEHFFSKKAYISRAKYLTEIFNKQYNFSYSWSQIFGEPVFLGWCMDRITGELYWNDDGSDE